MPCDENGNNLNPPTQRPPLSTSSSTNWHPFEDQSHFELADFLHREEQMPGSKIDRLMHILASYYTNSGQPPPFADHNDLYNAIDAIPFGEVAWQSFSVAYNGEKPTGRIPTWMNEDYTVWFRRPRETLRNQLANQDFAAEMDWAPKRVFGRGLKRQYKDSCQEIGHVRKR